MHLDINRNWDGSPGPGAAPTLQLQLRDVLSVRVDAPFHGDPPPELPPGPCPRLWEHEVVELFLLGAGDCYLEIELGPHEHHLVLQLEGRRHVVRSGLPIAFQARRSGARWQGEAQLPLAYLPEGLRALNAYAIFGPAGARQHLCYVPVPGPAPDFHRLECFAPCTLQQLR